MCACPRSCENLYGFPATQKEIFFLNLGEFIMLLDVRAMPTDGSRLKETKDLLFFQSSSGTCNYTTNGICAGAHAP